MTMVIVIMTMVKKYKETNNNNKTIIKWFFQPITQFSTSATTGNTNGNIGNAGVFTLGEKKNSRYISRKDIKSVTYQERVVFIYHVLENRYYLSQSHPCFDRAHICNIDTFKRWYLSCWYFWCLGARKQRHSNDMWDQHWGTHVSWSSG